MRSNPDTVRPKVNKTVLYNRVQFDFSNLSANSYSLSGRVIDREDGMVLEIEYEREDPYNIIGRPRHHHFSGEHTGSSDDTRVDARWASIGGREYVGLWV